MKWQLRQALTEVHYLLYPEVQIEQQGPDMQFKKPWHVEIHSFTAQPEHKIYIGVQENEAKLKTIFIIIVSMILNIKW